MITALLKENDEFTHTQIHQRQMILKMHAHRNTETVFLQIDFATQIIHM